MISTILSTDLAGIDAYGIQVEVDLSAGMPNFILVGLPETSVKESRERVRSAIVNQGFMYPDGILTLNLAPADIKKEGTQLDLPIAIGILRVSDIIPDSQRLANSTFIGELSLSGEIQGVRGALASALYARAAKKDIIVPMDNVDEVSILQDLKIFSFKTLSDIVLFLQGKVESKPVEPKSFEGSLSEPNFSIDFSEVKGQAMAKRALEVAAAGGHNVLMMGPPGAGKSMLSKRFPTILPSMSLEEAIETTKIHSARWSPINGKSTLITCRPFRSPHQTISYAGMIGGGSDPLPGEISLSNNGVLFLDEMNEFKRDVLEALRQPMEDGKVMVSRAKGSPVFPAKFSLIAACNPCPCGHLGDPNKPCRCTRTQIARYLQKISGPLLDRIDIQIEVPALRPAEINLLSEGESSKKIRDRVSIAREMQWERYKGTTIFCNANMATKEIKAYCRLGSVESSFLESAINSVGLSARGYDRVLKVSRTIADLEGVEKITSAHLAEAVQYRAFEKSLLTT